MHMHFHSRPDKGETTITTTTTTTATTHLAFLNLNGFFFISSENLMDFARLIHGPYLCMPLETIDRDRERLV